MTLYKLVQDVCNLGKSSPNVNFVSQGDIYQLNHNQDVEYPAFIVTQGTHTGSDYDEEQFTLTLFAVDRLVSDKSNEIDVQSWANGVLMDIIKKIEEFSIGIVQSGFKVQTFTEKFDSLCAGAYATIAVNVDNMDCDCGSKSIGFVTSVNGMTGDVIVKGAEGAAVTSVNGQTGDVHLNIPYKVSDLRNDVPYSSEIYVDNKIKDVSSYISNNYLKKGEVPVLDDYYTKEEVDDKIRDVSVDLSDYYTKEETYNREEIEAKISEAGVSSVKSVNGMTGDVSLFIPGKISDLVNDSNFIERTELSDYVSVSDYNQFVSDQHTIDEAQNGLLEALGGEIQTVTQILSDKQEQLVSGQNIKTINGESLLGSGDISIEPGSDTKHINITEAEYENLPMEEKMSDDIYFITDIKYVRYSEYEALEERVRILEGKINELLK